MVKIDEQRKSPSPYLVAIAGVSLLVLGGGVAYRSFLSRPTPQVAAIPKPIAVKKVSALGRLEPQGEVIQVFAPTSQEGARVELLKISHGQQLRKGDAIAILDTYARRFVSRWSCRKIS